ncbi:RNA 2',3'-cyclic phosphodiesterase [Marinobacter sp. F3R08]|uniref:RNA 2',3'-cyclic phosphodiesterase n=1 Tax=Marinobacter sp. F3R08 TaxID=2841559 RepID=UPI001C08CEFB|nr:RNA 2',3'-cyclic phosphodiesterase [Marinobacter sp. F3R08]MBU2954219.1 RNA 2',3'-cyclic phosphodiesterase [Marinobacter sp. F3R08]
MPRLFYGLEIPPEIKDRLLKVGSAVGGAQWQSAEQMHITLLFLGAVDERGLESVVSAARAIRPGSFELDVEGLGCFGTPQRPKYLWAGIRPEAPVAALREALVQEMGSLGPEPERRAFRPHITLARFKKQAGSLQGLLAEQGRWDFGQFPVTEFVLYDSKPGPTGSVYTVIERFSLQDRFCAK